MTSRSTTHEGHHSANRQPGQRASSKKSDAATATDRDAGELRLRGAPELSTLVKAPISRQLRRQLLDAARREIEALRKQNAVLKKQAALAEKAIAKARHFALHDELTGLPNRRLLLDRLSQAAAICERQHKQAALLFLDLDGFKRINDTYGHAVGDNLLQQVASRLVACMRISDTPCRYGGDEFIVLLSEIEDRQNAAAVAAKIRTRLARPYTVSGIQIMLSTSIGVAVYPSETEEHRDLVAIADRKMYQSKRNEPPFLQEPIHGNRKDDVA